MTPLDPMRIIGARLAQAREERHEAARERRQKRAEEDAIYAAIDRAVDEEAAFLRRCRDIAAWDVADLIATAQEPVIVDPPFIRYLPSSLPLPQAWVVTTYDETFAIAHDLDAALPHTVGGAL